MNIKNHFCTFLDYICIDDKDSGSVFYISIANYNLGVLDGEIRFYNCDSILTLEGNYKNGKKEGRFILYKTFCRRISEIIYFKNDMKDGVNMGFYHNDGSLFFIFFYRKGKRHGNCVWFGTTGKAFDESFYIKGKKIKKYK